MWDKLFGQQLTEAQAGAQGYPWGLPQPAHTWESQVHKCLELLQRLLLPFSVDLGLQGVATAELALEVLRAAQALELTLHHDGQPGAQGLTLLHAGERGVGLRQG